MRAFKMAVFCFSNFFYKRLLLHVHKITPGNISDATNPQRRLMQHHPPCLPPLERLPHNLLLPRSRLLAVSVLLKLLSLIPPILLRVCNGLNLSLA